MQPAAFLPRKRRTDDKVGDVDQVSQFDQIGRHAEIAVIFLHFGAQQRDAVQGPFQPLGGSDDRSEEHTSELQSLMRISYAVFCLKKTTISTPLTASPLIFLISITITNL